MDEILQEDIVKLKATRDKLRNGLDAYTKAIDELEKLGMITKETWNNPNRAWEYQEASGKINLKKVAIVNKLFEIGSDAILDFNKYGGKPEYELKVKSDANNSK